MRSVVPFGCWQVLGSVKATVEQIFSTDRGGKGRKDKDKKDDAIRQRVAIIMSKVVLARGWRTWKGNWQAHASNLATMRSSLRHLIQQPLSRAWNHWREQAKGRKRDSQLLGVALPFLKMHEQLVGFRAWKVMTVHRATTQRLTAASLSALARMRQKEVVATFDEWKKQRLLQERQPVGLCTALQRAFAKCSSSV